MLVYTNEKISLILFSDDMSFVDQEFDKAKKKAKIFGKKKKKKLIKEEYDIFEAKEEGKLKAN